MPGKMNLTRFLFMHSDALNMIQRAWLDALSGSKKEGDIKGFCQETKFDGIEVYQSSYQAALFNHLKSVFSIAPRLVGDFFMHELLWRYVKTHQSSSYDLNRYGDELAAYILTLKQTKTVPYLADFCRIEWQRHIASYYGLNEQFNFEVFSKLPIERVQSVKFAINPSLALIKSSYPIYQIWSMVYHDEEKQLSLEVGSESVAVFNNGTHTHVQKISDLENDFIEVLLTHASWQQAMVEMERLHPNADAEQLLHHGLLNQWITNFSVEGI